MTAVAGSMYWAVPVFYTAASAIAFTAYAIDKSAAVHGRRRIRESTLHLLAFAGGWPGALAAQRLLRHKSRKPAFQRVYWTTAVLNCAMLACLFLERGRLGLSLW